MTGTLTPTAAPTPETGTAAPRRRRPGRGIVLAISAGAAAIALGVGGLIATTAAFTDQETVTGNTVGTASLTIGDAVSAPIAVRDLVPGKEVTTPDVIEFRNTGSVDFVYTVAVTNIVSDIADPAVRDKVLRATIITIRSGDQAVTTSLLNPSALTPVQLAKGVDATVEVTVGLDEDADNDAQGRTTTFDLVVNATQVP